MSRPMKLIILSFVLLLCTSCDLTTKWWASENLKGASPIELVPDLLEFHYTENRAIAFSMLQNINQPLRNVIIYTSSLIAFLVLGMVSWQFRRESIWWLGSLAMIFSGAIGNLADRLVNGYVVDFIHLHYRDRFSWPIFNIADVVITIGAIALAVMMYIRSAEERKAVIAEQRTQIDSVENTE